MGYLLYALFALCFVLSSVIIWFFVDDLRQCQDYTSPDAGAPEGDTTSGFPERDAA